MRLTNYLRDAFIAAAMQDVPKTDYRELIQGRIDVLARELCPKEIAAVIDAGLESWLGCGSIFVPQLGYLRVHFAPELRSELEAAIREDAQIAAWAKADGAQSQQRTDLGAQLRSVAYGCTTRKALVSALPEFEKYAPEDEAAPSKNLPALANVAAEFTKAGWPKDKAAA